MPTNQIIDLLRQNFYYSTDRLHFDLSQRSANEISALAGRGFRHNDYFYKSGILYYHYYYHYFPYYSNNVYQLRQRIESLFSSTTLALRRKLVLQRDLGSGQNVLHILLSGKLFQIPNQINENHYCLSRTNRQTPSLEQILSAKTVKQHQAKQYENLSQLTTLVMEPFKEAPQQMAALFLAQDANGDTPLHSPKASFKAMKPLFESVYQLDEDIKKELAALQNNQGKNILHQIAQKGRPETLDMYCESLGFSASREAAFAYDNEGNTAFHLACTNSDKKRAALIKKLSQLENAAHSLASVALQANNERKNLLQLACRSHSASMEEDLLLLGSVCSMLEEKPNEDEPGNEDFQSRNKEKALRATTAKGWSALHYACRSGNTAKVQLLLEGLTEQAKQKICSAKNNRKWTPLHYACRYGDKEMVEIIIDALGSENAYQLTRVDARKDLLNLLNQNPHPDKIYCSEYHSRLNKKLGLLDAYHYLSARSQEYSYGLASRQKNYEAELRDFCEGLFNLQQGKTLPAAKEDLFAQRSCCFFSRRTPYPELRKKFKWATAEQVEELLSSLGKKTKCRFARTILEKLGKMQEQQQRVQEEGVPDRLGRYSAAPAL